MTADTRRRRWTRLGMIALALPVALFMLLRWFEHKQTYHPGRTLYSSGAELGRPWQDIWFTTTDGRRLNGWFFPAHAQSPRARMAFLVCHGNGGNMGHRLALADALLHTGAAVFLFDYGGYGLSEGRPNEEGTYLDAQAAHTWLAQQGFSAANIIAFGESLGGGVASELAVRESLAGLVLECTFTSLPDVGAELFPWLPVKWLGHIRYDTHAKLPGIHVPVLVMHSRQDSLIRFHHAERNFAAANEPKLLCEVSGDHNDVVLNRPKFDAALEAFLKRLGAGALKP